MPSFNGIPDSLRWVFPASSEPAKRRVVVSGANGEVGSATVKKLAEEGFEVIAVVRNTKGLLNTKEVTWVQLSGDIAEEKTWHDIAEKYDAVDGVHCIGGIETSDPKVGKKINVDSAGAFAKGIRSYQKERNQEKAEEQKYGRLELISSVAAELIPTEQYGKDKLEAERAFEEGARAAGDTKGVYSLRLGYVISEPTEEAVGGKQATQAYAFNQQFHGFAIVPSKKETPVPIVALRDVQDAIVELFHIDDKKLSDVVGESHTINLVSNEELSQGTIMRTLQGEGLHLLYLPDVASRTAGAVSRIFPYGHFSPMAFAGMRAVEKMEEDGKLSSWIAKNGQVLERLIGRPPTKTAEMAEKTTVVQYPLDGHAKTAARQMKQMAKQNKEPLLAVTGVGVMYGISRLAPLKTRNIQPVPQSPRGGSVSQVARIARLAGRFAKLL